MAVQIVGATSVMFHVLHGHVFHILTWSISAVVVVVVVMLMLLQYDQLQA